MITIFLKIDLMSFIAIIVWFFLLMIKFFISYLIFKNQNFASHGQMALICHNRYFNQKHSEYSNFIFSIFIMSKTFMSYLKNNYLLHLNVIFFRLQDQ